ncbi:hypothetical protein OH76DRAFT_535809 [Lentinus brumalis]|uniref:Uncharacterized protein n=1 Tax=Lentinus brumalis TaxID=2498619 RepID=A0A371DAF2_9APHY|nr:hypothetical protein OH76DRAFT_535809 [Polyporus brumalis]
MCETCPNDQIGNIDASCGPDRQDRALLVIDRSVPKKRGRLVDLLWPLASSSSLRWIHNFQRQVYSILTSASCNVIVHDSLIRLPTMLAHWKTKKGRAVIRGRPVGRLCGWLIDDLSSAKIFSQPGDDENIEQLLTCYEAEREQATEHSPVFGGKAIT